MATILVVDDLEQLRHLLEDLLIEAGHTVVCAENGSEGIDRASEQLFDLLISDIFMPQMDGLEFIREVSQLQPSVPIIAMSGGFLEAVEELLSSKN